MPKSKNIKVGMSFATGRSSFQNVLRTTIYKWKESCLVENKGKRTDFNPFVFLLVFLIIPFTLSLPNFVQKSLNCQENITQ